MDSFQSAPPVDWSKPYGTKNGKAARLIGTVNHPVYTHIVAVSDSAGNEMVESYMTTGRYSKDISTDQDLININLVDIWLLVDKDTNTTIHYSRQDAIAFAKEELGTTLDHVAILHVKKTFNFGTCD